MTRHPLAWLFFAALAISFYLFHSRNNPPKLDFYNAWGIAQLAPEMGDSDIYAKSTNRQMGITLVLHGNSSGGAAQIAAEELRRSWRSNTNATGTPFFYSTYKALSLNDYNVDYIAHGALSATAFIAALAIFLHLTQLQPITAIVFSLTACFLLKPVAINEYEGNVASYQLTFLALYTLSWHQSKHLLSGFILTAGIIFKPTLHWVMIAHLSFILIGGLKQEAFRFILGSAIAAIMCTAASLCWIGTPNTWCDFFKSLASTLHPSTYGSLTPVGWIWRTTHWNVSLPFFLAAGLCIAWISKRIPRQQMHHGEYPQIAMALGIPLMLLTSSLAWAHYYTLLIPPLIWLIGNTKSHPYQTVAAIIVTLALTPLAGSLYPNEIAAWGAYAFCALIVATGAAGRILRPSRT